MGTGRCREGSCGCHRALPQLIHPGTNENNFRDVVIYSRLQWFLAQSSSLCRQSPPHISTRILLLTGCGERQRHARCCQQVKAIKLSLRSALGSLCWSCTKQFKRTCSWMTEKSRPPQTSSTHSSIKRSNLLISSSTQYREGVCVHT